MRDPSSLDWPMDWCYDEQGKQNTLSLQTSIDLTPLEDSRVSYSSANRPQWLVYFSCPGHPGGSGCAGPRGSGARRVRRCGSPDRGIAGSRREVLAARAIASTDVRSCDCSRSLSRCIPERDAILVCDVHAQVMQGYGRKSKPLRHSLYHPRLGIFETLEDIPGGSG